MQSITKLCADSLREFVQTNYGVKLKSSHAHELVAAYFGYKSNAAMLADKDKLLARLNEVYYLVWDVQLAALRLRDLGYEQLSSELLIPCFDLILQSQDSFDIEVCENIRRAILRVIDQRLEFRFGRIWPEANKFDWDVQASAYFNDPNGDVLWQVDLGYFDTAGKRLRDSKYLITLPLVAGKVGYGEPAVKETRYAGEFRAI